MLYMEITSVFPMCIRQLWHMMTPNIIRCNRSLCCPCRMETSFCNWKKKFPQMNRVTGPDLMRRLFEESKEKKIRHYFYGTTQENINALLEKIKKEYPWVEVVGYEPSVFRPLSEEEENALIARINQTNPDIVWVALGAPRQEEFCYKMQGKINGLMIGVGGAFNVVSGVIDEAPQWMQDISLEWFYRFMKEPKRLFRRYLVTNSKFIWLSLLNEHTKIR